MFSTVGEAVGRALAVMASAVDDLPNVTEREDVCKESLGRLLCAAEGTRVSISLLVSAGSDIRLLVLLWTLCVECVDGVGFMARASMSEGSVLVRPDPMRSGPGRALQAGGPRMGEVTVRLMKRNRLTDVGRPANCSRRVVYLVMSAGKNRAVAMWRMWPAILSEKRWHRRWSN